MQKGLKCNRFEEIVTERLDSSVLEARGVSDIKEVVEREDPITVTTIYGKFEDRQFVVSGISRRCPGDQMNRKIGNALSRNRAVEKFNKILDSLKK